MSQKKKQRLQNQKLKEQQQEYVSPTQSQLKTTIQGQAPLSLISQQSVLLDQYRLPQICEIFSSFELPDNWKANQWADRIDNIVLKSGAEIQAQQDQVQEQQQTSTTNTSDYLTDLYHFKEVARLLTLNDIKKLRSEFEKIDVEDKGSNLEQFVLLLLQIIKIDQPRHMPFLINGIRTLYNVITMKYNVTRVTFTCFLNYYFVGQLVSSSFENNENEYQQADQKNDQDRNQQYLAGLKHFEDLKKSKYGFFTSKFQDVVHHDNPIKSVQFSEELGVIFSLDEQSDYFRMYNNQTLLLMKKIQTDSPKHKVKPIRLLDICWSQKQKILGACCQDMKISFWMSNLKIEYCFSSEAFGLQLKMYYIEMLNTWVTISQHNEIIEWTFMNQIDSSKGQQGGLKKITNQTQGSQPKKTSFKNIEQKDGQTNIDNDNRKGHGGPVFTQSSVAVGKPWPFKSKAKISFIKEIAALKKLMIATFDQRITVWNPIRNCVFVTIEIPNGFSSAHSLAFSERMNLIFSAGFDQSILIWGLDEVNQDYNKIGRIEVSNPGISVSAIECFDEFGLIITLDESGMMRCWDIEKWKIAYKVDLGCPIKNTISQIIRLELGRFIVVTSRLHVFEFPVKQPRGVQSKFQPLDQMGFNFIKSQIQIASKSDLIALNINNAIVEEKYNNENSTITANMKGFIDSILQRQIYSIDARGFLLKLDHKGAKNSTIEEFNQFQANDDSITFQQKEKVEEDQKPNQNKIILFDKEQLQGTHYYWCQDILTAWSQNTVKIYQGSQAIQTAQQQKKGQQAQPFYMVRSLHFENPDDQILQVKSLPHRDVIGVLLKSHVLIFLKFNTLQQLGSLSLKLSDDELSGQNQLKIEDTLVEIMQFDILTDFNAIILFDSSMNLYFVKQTQNYSIFQGMCKIHPRCLLQENTLYKNAQSFYFCKLNIHQIFHSKIECVVGNFINQKQKRQNSKLDKDLKNANSDPFLDESSNYDLLYKLKDLWQQKDQFLKNMIKGDHPPPKLSSGQIFKQSVRKIIKLIKNDKIHLLGVEPPHRLFTPTQDVQKQGPLKLIDILKAFTLSQMNQPVSNSQTNRSDAMDETVEDVDIGLSKYEDLYSHDLSLILENLSYENYISMSNNKGRLVFLNIGKFLLNNFDQIQTEYLNKQINTRVFTVLNKADTSINKVIVLKQVYFKFICNSQMDISKTQITFKHINAHQKCKIIQTQLYHFNNKLLLFSFGNEDNMLKVWDVSDQKFPYAAQVDESFMDQKAQEIRSMSKIQELIQNMKLEDVETELKIHRTQLQFIKKKLKNIVTYSLEEEKINISSLTHSEGKYILPIETKIKWNLKYYFLQKNLIFRTLNKKYREKQMKQTIKLLHKMMNRWLYANKYLEIMLKNQIQMYQVQSEKLRKIQDKSQNKYNFLHQFPMTDSLGRSEKLNETPQEIQDIGNMTQSLSHDSQQFEQRDQLKEEFKDHTNATTSQNQEESKNNMSRSGNKSLKKISSARQARQRGQISDQSRQSRKQKHLTEDSQLTGDESRDLSQKRTKKKSKGTIETSDKDRQLMEQIYGENLLLSSAERVENLLKDCHKKTIELNQGFNDIYFPTTEKVAPKEKKEKKRKNKYDIDLIKTTYTKDSDKGVQLLNLNLRTQSSEKIKYLLNYKFNDVSQYQQKQIENTINNNNTQRIVLNKINFDSSQDKQESIERSLSKKNHYLNYFLKDVQQNLKVNGEYFSDFKGVIQQSVPRQKFMKKIDELVKLSKNFNNTKFQINQDSPKGKMLKTQDPNLKRLNRNINNLEPQQTARTQNNLSAVSYHSRKSTSRLSKIIT